MYIRGVDLIVAPNLATTNFEARVLPEFVEAFP